MRVQHAARVAPEEAVFRPALPSCPLPGMKEMQMSKRQDFEEPVIEDDDDVVVPYQAEVRAFVNKLGTVTITVQDEGFVAVSPEVLRPLAYRLIALADAEFPAATEGRSS